MNSLQNSLQAFRNYDHHGIYVFDDPNVDLSREPFVMGIPEIIED